MKWEHKGYEYIKKTQRILEKVSLENGIYLFGAGEFAKSMCSPLFYFSVVRGVIDNSPDRQGECFQGKEIISFDTFLHKREKEIIVLAVSDKNIHEIRRQLLDKGLLEDIDFFKYEKFMSDIFPFLLSYQQKKNYVDLVQISLTERCTLKCKKCAHGCHVVSADRADLTLEEVKESVDYFFQFTDYVMYFVLIGGEPLLYRNMVPVIEYISKNYGDRIGRLQITTNGSIIPKEELLRCCKKYNVFFMISNYTRQVEWIYKKLETLTKILHNEGIPYVLFPQETIWMDYGFDYLNRNASEEQLIKVFDACRTGCHEIRKNRFYFCVMARSVSENMMNSEIGQNDYLDLSLLDFRDELDRRIYFEYVIGYSDKGYLEMCNYCNGASSSCYPIPAAEQMI